MPRGNKKRKRTDKARGSRVSLEVEDHTQDSGTRLWKTAHGDHLVVESGAFSDDEESVVSIEPRKLRTMKKKSLSLSPSNKKQRIDSSTPSTPVPGIPRNKGTLMDLKSIGDLLDDTQDDPVSLLEGLQQVLKKLDDDYHLKQLSENSSEFRDQRNRKLRAMASLLSMISTMFQSGVVELSVEDKFQLEKSIGKVTETQTTRTDTSPRGRERIPDIIEPETPNTRGQARPPRSQTPSRRGRDSGSRHSSERHRVLQEAIVFPGEAQYTNGVEVASNNGESSRNPLPNIYNDQLRPNPPTILSIDRTQSQGTVVEDPFLTTQEFAEFVQGVCHTMNAQHRMRQNPQAWKKLLASMMDSLDEKDLDSEIDKPPQQESQSFLRRLWRFWHLSPHTTASYTP
jgi:hypothetical protein